MIPRSRQSGAALIVVLLLLVIVTLLGLASMRGAIMQERMAANIMGRSMAFQAAEAGLRQAEIIARDGTMPFPAATSAPGTCSAGYCLMVSPPAKAAWDTTDGSFWSSGSGFKSGTPVSVGDGDITPRFVIEKFGSTTSGVGASSCVDASKPCIESAVQNVYRITSYAKAGNGAEVVLQSLYRR
jgi:type IV pilus assembly protein PilX